MKKKLVIRVLAAMGVAFIIGLVLIFSSPSIGRITGDIAIRNNGGEMDTNQFERIIDETTTSYRIGGLVISLVSGLGAVVSGYALYKEI